MAVYNSNNQPNVNNSNVVLAAQSSEIGVKKTMSSLEMAELAGKPHNDLLKSIRNMEAAWIKVTGGNFSLSNYIDSTGRKLPCYNFNYEESMYIASKFDDETRAKLTIRWAKLETGQTTPIYQQPKQHKPKQVNASKKRVEAFGAWVTMLSSAMNLDEYSKYMLIKQEGEQLMFPVPEAPVCEAPVDNLTNLLNAHNVMNGNKPMKAHAFHVILVNKGYMREIPRAKSNGKPDNYYSFTDKGLKFGINRWDKYSSSPKSKDYFFIDKFAELLKELNLV